MTVASGPTLWEAVNPQVGLASFFPCSFFEILSLTVGGVLHL
jgi:hypothetical protein